MRFLSCAKQMALKLPCLMSLLLLSSSAVPVEAAPNVQGQVIGVLPILGSPNAAPEIVKALRGYEGIKIVSLANVDNVLGSKAAGRLAECTTDICKNEVLGPLNLGLFIDGELLSASRGQNLRLRLVSTSTIGEKALKVTANQSVADASIASLRLAVLDTVASLFSEFGLKGFGSLRIETSPVAATVVLNDEVVGISPVGPIRMRQGEHKLRISHPGHKTWDGKVTIQLGETANIKAELIMNRSELPFYLGTGALSTAITGLVFGLHASSIAGRWSDACTDGVCQDGFSAQRHYDETRLVNAERNVANGLLATAVGLGISALTVYLLDEGTAEVTP